MKGASWLLVTRYVVFALFTICNAIICSVAVWNSSLVHSTQSFQVDIYLTFLGAFSLVTIFTLLFVELLCVNTITTRVWFESAWIALFWLMELAGGAALIATKSDITCSSQATRPLDISCTSERVLLAFTWMCAIMLLVYLLTLSFIVTSQYHEDPKIWDFDVRTLRVTILRHCSSSTPNSPSTTRVKKRAGVDIYTPRPVRAQPIQLLYHRETEPFGPLFTGPEQMDVPHSPNLPEAVPVPPLAAAQVVPSSIKPILAPLRNAGNMRSLSISRFDPSQGLASSITYSVPGAPTPGPVARQSNPSPSPPPLGDWPRLDVMQLPVKPKPKPPLPAGPEFPTPDTVTQPRPRRPSGPRLRVHSVESGHRPPPLDLSRISNYETVYRH